MTGMSPQSATVLMGWKGSVLIAQIFHKQPNDKFRIAIPTCSLETSYFHEISHIRSINNNSYIQYSVNSYYIIIKLIL